MTRCTVVVAGAPLAARTHDVVIALQLAGHEVDLIATDSAREWMDVAAVAADTRSEVRQSARTDQSSPRQALPDFVVICPATFNTLNKLAVGIADTRAHSFLAECIAERVSILCVPMINARLWKHPALAPHIELLVTAGVNFLDIHTGGPGAREVQSGTGPEVVARFEADWIPQALVDRG